MRATEEAPLAARGVAEAGELAEQAPTATTILRRALFRLTQKVAAERAPAPKAMAVPVMRQVSVRLGRQVRLAAAAPTGVVVVAAWGAAEEDLGLAAAARAGQAAQAVQVPRGLSFSPCGSDRWQSTHLFWPADSWRT